MPQIVKLAWSSACRLKCKEKSTSAAFTDDHLPTLTYMYQNYRNFEAIKLWKFCETRMHCSEQTKQF